MANLNRQRATGRHSAVRIMAHPVNWEEATEFDEITRSKLQALGRQIERGCWYINPAYTVYSPSLTAEFFGRVTERRSAWLYTCCQSTGAFGHRQEVRKLEKLGRKEGYLNLDSVATLGLQMESPPPILPLSELSETDRRDVIRIGRLVREAAFSGLLFINGAYTPGAVWKVMAKDLRKPSGDPELLTTPRHVDLAPIKANGDTGYLKGISRSELGNLMEACPGRAFYVCPGSTVSSTSFNREFLDEARKRAREWHGKLQHLLGSEKKNLFKDTDQTTRLLVSHGSLVVDQQIFIPGLWPGDKVTADKLNRTPYKSPTVPPEYLGLKATNFM